MLVHPAAGGQPGHRPVPHGGGQLAHPLGAAVPGGEHPGQTGLAVLPGQQVAVLVHGDQGGEGPVLGLLAHGDEQPVHLQLLGLAGDPVPDGHAGEAALPGQQLLHRAVHLTDNVVPGQRLLHQPPGPPELLPAVDQSDLGTDSGQEQGVLEGGVPAPHHGRRLSSVEGAVAHGAVGDALAHQLLLPGQAQGAVLHPGGQHQGPALPQGAVGGHLKTVPVGAEAGDRLVLQLHPQLLRLAQQVL